MPEKFGGKTFWTREEAEAAGMVLPRQLTDEELAARRERWAEKVRNAPPRPAGEPDYRSSKNYRDDLVGTEFEGWTRNPETDEWFDAKGRPAYDANRQRIVYPDAIESE
ncbi:hypothetical protein [Nocardia stercoris]|uniref:hypothetical protein n=1 Tax=Nocardia stercoris TaxID=2483361 RepID=UPI0011C39B09|nr:hypothetical protein [Nocardia stercoris]